MFIQLGSIAREKNQKIMSTYDITKCENISGNTCYNHEKTYRTVNAMTNSQTLCERIWAFVVFLLRFHIVRLLLFFSLLLSVLARLWWWRMILFFENFLSFFPTVKLDKYASRSQIGCAKCLYSFASILLLFFWCICFDVISLYSPYSYGFALALFFNVRSIVANSNQNRARIV